MSQEDAKRKFVDLLLSRVPALSHMLEDMKKEREEKERMELEKREAAAKEEERLKQLREQEQRRKREEEERCVLTSLLYVYLCVCLSVCQFVVHVRR